MEGAQDELSAARAALRGHVDRLAVGVARTGLAFAGLLVLVSLTPFVRVASEHGLGEALDLGAADGLCSNLCGCLFAGALIAAMARPLVRYRFQPLLDESELIDGRIVRVQGWGAVPSGGWLRAVVIGAQVFSWIGGLPALPFQIHYELNGVSHSVQAFAYPEDAIEEGPARLLVRADRAWLVGAGRYSESLGTRSA